MPVDILQKFTTHIKESLKKGLALSLELKHAQITPWHLLYGLMAQKGSVASEILSKAGLLKEKIILLLSALPKTRLENEQPNFSSDCGKILEKAAVLAFKNGHHYIGTEHLLSALIQSKNPEILKFLSEQKINLHHLRQDVLSVLQGVSRFPDLISLNRMSLLNGEWPASLQREETIKTASLKNASKKTPALNFFALELTSPASQKKLDPIIGREKEIRRLIQILCRRTKNNPVLLGDPGVGKTAIVEGLAQKIFRREVPPALEEKRLFRLDLGLLVAGTIYRGEFESRLKQLLEEIKANPDIIVFIDELHTIVGAGSASGSLDAANMLKPALSRGEMRCIGATTFEEYKKHIESDAALERRFQPILVNEPTAPETIAILAGLKENFEEFHALRISDEALVASVNLAKRYRQDKFFPDKAIDLLDEAASAKKLAVKESVLERQHRNFLIEWKKISEAKQQAVLAENFEKALELKKVEEEMAGQADAQEQKLKKQPRQKIILTAADVANVIADTVGLPTAEILEEEKTKLVNLEEELRQKIVGQEEVILSVSRALRRARLGLGHPDRPLASFFFVGPTGVGKTELAKILAETIFKDPDAFLRVDMSEFSEGFQVSKLIGSPAGYVGYKEGNKFTDRVKNRPYSLILFDEVDKAHPDVFHILLQILDEGYLSDAVGKKINFKNTVIVMTSNLGGEFFSSSFLGFGEKRQNETGVKNFESVKNSVLKELKNRFRSEFLNRLDSILFFRPLNVADLEKIANLKILALNQRLAAKNIYLEPRPAVKKQLAQKARAMDEGARAIAKVIQTEIEEPLAAWLVQNPPREKRTVQIELKEKQIRLQYV